MPAKTNRRRWLSSAAIVLCMGIPAAGFSASASASDISTIVTKVDPNTNALTLEAISVERGGTSQSFSASSLINVTVTDYAVATTIPFESSVLGIEQIPGAEINVPAPGSRAGVLSDLSLSSALQNPSVSTGLVIEFDQEILDVDGADIVVFELSPPIGAMPPSGGPTVLGGDPFTAVVADVGEQTFTAEDYELFGGNGFAGPSSFFSGAGPITSLEDLESVDLNFLITTGLNLYGTTIDLAEFATLPDGFSLSALQLLSVAPSGFAPDFALIAGLPDAATASDGLTLTDDFLTVINTGALGATGLGQAALTIEGVGATISNSGTITSASGAAISLSLPDDFIALPDTVTRSIITNSGTITGDGTAIITGAEGTSLINTGTINGNILFGSGDDDLTLSSGSVLNSTLVDGGSSDGEFNSLTFDATSDMSIAGDIFSNFQNAVLTGGASLTFTSAFAADVLTVGTGTLILTDAAPISASVFVGDSPADAAVLTGSGTITGSLTNNATLTPGAGGITVIGDISIADGSTTTFDLDADTPGLSAVAVVSESGATTGGTIDVAGGTAIFETDTPVTADFTTEIVSADAGATGAFSSIASPAFTDVSLTFGPTGIVAVGDFLLDNPTLSAASTPVAGYVAGLLSTPVTPAVASTLTALGALDEPALDTALVTLSPEAVASSALIFSAQATDVYVRAITDRVDRVMADRGAKKLAIWGQGQTTYTEHQGTDTVSGLDADVFSISSGIDYWVTDNILLGIAGSYTDGDIDFDDLSADADLNTGIISGYGLYTNYGYRFTLAGGFGFGELDTARDIAAGTILGTADADIDLDQFIVYGEIAYRLNENGPIWLEPSAALSYTNADQETTTETGAEGLNLVLDGQDIETLFLDVQFRVGGQLPLFGFQVRPELTLGWRYDVLDDDSFQTAGLDGAGPTRFTVAGVELDRNSFVGGLGSIIEVTQNIRLFGHYDVIVGGDITSHQLSGGLQIRF